MSASLPRWLMPLWQRALADLNRLPHAILLTGPQGSGKRRFAEALAQRLLCQRAQHDEFACGECPACSWYKDANHPDMVRLLPASEEAKDKAGEGGDEAESADSGKKEKAKSAQIVIDQVRGMQSMLELGGHQGGRRIILIEPLEAMNPAAANALLKSLEEPATDAVFLLVCHAPGRLLATIRSRCQTWPLPRPEALEAAAWLAANKVKNPKALLGFASGLPLAAQEIAAGPLAAARERFVRDMAALPKGDPLKLAGEWEAWLKSKAAIEAGLNMAQLLGWLQRWLADGALVAAQAAPRFFSDCEAALAASVRQRGDDWLACYHDLMAYCRVAQHPLNARLMLEDVLLRAGRVMA